MPASCPTPRPGRAARLVRIQLALVVAIVVAAAGMARYGGL
ncbi:MAG TPA: hypothetical protein VIG88_07455 [Lysobacter sp.]